MKLLKAFLLISALLPVSLIFSQVPAEVKTDPSSPTTPGEPIETPLDDIVERNLIDERPLLAYDPIREHDIFYEHRIWRIIDVREKMNLPFIYPERPFFSIIVDAARQGNITVYSVEDDKFKHPLNKEEVEGMLSTRDTVITFDPETYEEIVKVAINEINWEDVKRFRVKEVWFFDKEASRMRVRILGIAPLINSYDNNGNFRFEKPMFWAYYPQCRSIFSKEKVFNMGGNDSAPITWDDLFEMRFFASFIYKDSNVYDRKIEDFMTGVDVMLESEKIKNDLFNTEHDLWSY